jgi:hypothetical protein
MENNLRAIIILFCGLCYSTIANSQSIDSILGKHFQAIGGLEKWESLKSVKMVRSHYYSQDENFINTIFVIANKAFRHESVLESGQNHMIYGIYENEGWRVNAPMPINSSFTFSEMSNDESAFYMEQTDLLFGLGNYKNTTNQCEYSGRMTIEGKENFEIKVKTKEGKKVSYFFDSTTFLLTKISGNVSILGIGMQVQSDVYFSNFKNVEGYMFPFTISFSSNQISFGQRRVFNVESISINPEMDIEIFKKSKL